MIIIQQINGLKLLRLFSSTTFYRMQDSSSEKNLEFFFFLRTDEYQNNHDQ